MRIVGGEWRGRSLTSLGKGDPAAHLRPTPDRVRESLFNILSHGASSPEGAIVLDVFAGTGAMGFEALSRGAAMATFIDNGRAAQRLLNANAALLGAGEKARIINRDARRPGPPAGKQATLVFLDPPYGTQLGHQSLAGLRDKGWIADGALILWEDDRPQTALPGFSLTGTRGFGQTQVTILTAEAAPS